MNEENSYSDEVTENQLIELEDQLQEMQSKNVQLNQAMTSLSSENKDENFLHYQISTQELIEKLEHFYRGDFQATDEEGNTYWEEQDNKDLVTFNDFGVTSMMEIVTKYIDKNTMLSYYTEERINQILGGLGDELVLFILCNYDKLGMDTHFKKSKFRLIVVTTLNIIESTYRRALRGRTMEDLNQSKVVGQFGNMPNEQPRSMGRPNIIRRIIGR